MPLPKELPLMRMPLTEIEDTIYLLFDYYQQLQQQDPGHELLSLGTIGENEFVRSPALEERYRLCPEEHQYASLVRYTDALHCAVRGAEYRKTATDRTPSEVARAAVFDDLEELPGIPEEEWWKNQPDLN